MDANQFSVDLIKKFQQFFAHMDQQCQKFLKGENIAVQPSQSPKHEKKEKKERDPDAPKKPLTPFFIFSQKYREKVLERNPEVKLTQVAQMAGNKWKSMTEQEKQPYVNQYNEGREKYEGEIKDYNDKHGIVVSDKKRKKSEKFDEKSMKSANDHQIEDLESESVHPIIKQTQPKQQQQQQKKKAEPINVTDDEQEKKPVKQQQKTIQVKTKKAPQDIDDDLQKEINQVINQDKPKKQKK